MGGRYHYDCSIVGGTNVQLNIQQHEDKDGMIYYTAMLSFIADGDLPVFALGESLMQKTGEFLDGYNER